VANYDSDTVSVFDSNSGSTKSIRVGVSPTSIAVDPFFSKIYVANARSDSVSVIDGINDSKIGKDIPVGKAPVYVAASGGRIYVANFDDNTVSVINSSTYTKVVPDIPVLPDPMYITAERTIDVFGDGLSVINRTTDTKMLDIPVGDGAHRIQEEFNGHFQKNVIYVPNPDDGNVYVVLPTDILHKKAQSIQVEIIPVGEYR